MNNAFTALENKLIGFRTEHYVGAHPTTAGQGK
jgi:hypothetical protein